VRAGELIERLPIGKPVLHDVIGPPSILTLQRSSAQTFAKHGKRSGSSIPRRVFMLPDHSIPAYSVEVAEGVDLMESFGRECGLKVYREGDGIEHVVLIEDGHIVPWDIVLGTDSHTCTNGAMGALAFGVGTTDGALRHGDRPHLRLRGPGDVPVRVDRQISERGSTPRT